MFYEYALEPGAITSWDSARYFLDAFGPWKGRLLSQYPKDWVKQLLGSLTCGDSQKKAIAERLESAKKNKVFFRRAGTSYDGTIPWLDNARREHARQAFHAIVACSASSEEYVLDASELDERHPKWKVDAGKLVSRQPAVYIQALELLLIASSAIIVVDPYFRADHADKVLPLTALCSRICGKIETVQVHLGDTLGYALAMQHAERALPSCIPAGMKVSLHYWKRRLGGERLHNRYVLTDVGGVQFGDSIEKGARGEHDRVSILEEVTRAKLWEDYAGPQLAYDRGGVPRTFVGTKSR